jgi:hypothetical protein
MLCPEEETWESLARRALGHKLQPFKSYEGLQVACSRGFVLLQSVPVTWPSNRVFKCILEYADMTLWPYLTKIKLTLKKLASLFS